MRRGGAAGDTIRGQDLVIKVDTALFNPGVGYRIPCNPRFWPNTKAYVASLGWQTYTPHSVTVKWNPGLAATTPGQIVAGSLTYRQTLSSATIANALLATKGSYSGPVWQPATIQMDLSTLTQPKYFLNEVQEDGVPVCVYLQLPTGAIGILEVVYHFSFWGASSAPVNVGVYDLVARTITTPADVITSNMLVSTAGMGWSNNYNLTWAGAPLNAVITTLAPAAGGGVCTNSDYVGTTVTVKVAAAGNGISVLEGATPLVLYAVTMINLPIYGFFSGTTA